MLAEILSFGGLWKEKKVHLVQDENVVQVIVKSKARDKEGRMTYQTVESFDVAGATPEQVANAIETFLNGKPANSTAPAKK